VAPTAVIARAPPSSVCVGAVLGDALRRVCALGGCEGTPRSLGSVYSGMVTRFLGRGLRGVESRVIVTPGVTAMYGGIAVSRDGSTVLVADCNDGSNAIHVFSVADGSRLRIVGGAGDGPLQFQSPRQLWIAPDDYVFVADLVNDRVQVLTPQLDFYAFFGVGQLTRPTGVCANDDVVIVVELAMLERLSVFSRADGTLLRWIGGRKDGRPYPPFGRSQRRSGIVPQLGSPSGLCFTHGGRNVAVAEWLSNRVGIYSIASGELICHVGVGTLISPTSVACSAFNELVIADMGHVHVVALGAPHKREVFKTMGRGDFSGVVVHGGRIFATNNGPRRTSCVVFE
jgi:DNA-binding beta-propeller fold protein YncE